MDNLDILLELFKAWAPESPTDLKGKQNAIQLFEGLKHENNISK